MNKNLLILGVLALCSLASCKKTDGGVVACLDARMRTSDAWRTFARAAETGATAQEAAAKDAQEAAERGVATKQGEALFATAKTQKTLAERFRTRATHASMAAERLGNPFIETVEVRGWGSNETDPGKTELVAVHTASEAAWEACKVYCVDTHCSQGVPALALGAGSK
jgi:hypothetical protein